MTSKEVANSPTKHFLSGTFLIMGTSIGAGMLGLPVDTAQMGFKPAVLAYMICWVAMTASGILFLEVLIKMKQKANIRTMVCETLGKTPARIIDFLFLGLYYSLLVAYMKGYTQLISNAFPWMSISVNYLLFFLLFIPCVLFKEKGIKGINTLFVLGLFLSYAFIVCLGIPQIDFRLLSRAAWNTSIYSMPIILTAFGFHVVIPSLFYYQGESAKTTRLSIVVGTTITTIIYICWQLVVIGIIPLSSLQEALVNDQTAIIPLSKRLGQSSLSVLGQLFGFFALASSCLGVSIAFYDFIADRFKIDRSTNGKVALISIIFVPPLCILSSKAQIFYLALRYGGGMGVLLLLILLPALMVLAQAKRTEKPYENFPIHKWIVVGLLLAFCFFGLVSNGLYLSKH